MIRAQTLRQLLIATGLTICSISDGFIIGQMSGMIAALSSKDSSIVLTNEDLSWMASTINVLCIFGFLIMGTIMELLGRRKAISIVNLPVTACWIIIYFIQEKVLLLLTRIILGVCFGGVLVMVYTGIAEYQPPRFRPLSVNLIANVGSLIGTALGHVLSILLDWRIVALIGVIPSGISVIMPFFWTESPPWLAANGRYEECERAFKSLHVQSDASDNELRLLLAYERKKRSEMSTNAPRAILGKKITMAVKQMYFWKISLFCTIVCIYRVASGRILFNTLALTMLQDITGTVDIFFYTIAADGFTILGSLFSCYFLYRFKTRPLFFTAGITANAFLVILGLCLYLFPDNDIYLAWTKVALLALYFVTLMAGPYAILDTLLSEVFPVEIKSFFIVVVGIVSGVLHFLSIKLVPDMLAVIGYHGIFLVNAAIIFLCILYLWFYLPETKGRSLHEIEYYFKNNTFNYSKELFMSKQTDDLLNKSI